MKDVPVLLALLLTSCVLFECVPRHVCVLLSVLSVLLVVAHRVVCVGVCLPAYLFSVYRICEHQMTNIKKRREETN